MAGVTDSPYKNNDAALTLTPGQLTLGFPFDRIKK